MWRMLIFSYKRIICNVAVWLNFIFRALILGHFGILILLHDKLVSEINSMERLFQKLVLSYQSPYPQPHEVGPHLHPPVFSRSILILPYDLCLGLSAGLSSSIQNFYVFLITPLYSSYLTHSIGLFDYPNNIWWRVWIMKLLIIQFSPAGVTSSVLGPNILLSTLFSVLPLRWDTMFHTHSKQQVKM